MTNKIVSLLVVAALVLVAALGTIAAAPAPTVTAGKYLVLPFMVDVWYVDGSYLHLPSGPTPACGPETIASPPSASLSEPPHTALPTCYYAGERVDLTNVSILKIDGIVNYPGWVAWYHWRYFVITTTAAK